MSRSLETTMPLITGFDDVVSYSERYYNAPVITANEKPTIAKAQYAVSTCFV